jgi:hypothetical protein
MDASRLTLTDNGFELAVAVRRFPDQHTHAGLCYRDKGVLWFLDLAEDRVVDHKLYAGDYACAVPRIHPLRLRFFVNLCRVLGDKRPQLRYALRHPENARFVIQANGDVVLTKGGAGLNCSTFVLVVFQSYGWPLVSLAGWQQRPEDAAWHARLVAWVARKDPAQAALIQLEIGCARVRPEETAGACLEDVLPACFSQCVANGAHILRAIGAAAAGS